MTKIIDRYLLKHLLDYFLLALVVLCLIAFFSDTLLDFLRDMQKLGISFMTGFTLIGLQLPKTIAFVLPACAFIAVLMVYSQLNQNFEIIALRMSGISLQRLAAPALALGLATAGCAYLLGDYVVPFCNQQSEMLMEEAIRNGSLPFGRESLTFKNYDANNNLERMIFIGRAEGHNLFDCTIMDLTRKNVLQVIQAKKGHWFPDRWEFNTANAYTVSKTSDVLFFNHMEKFYVRNMFTSDEAEEEAQEQTETKSDNNLSIDSDTQSFFELWDTYQRRQAAGRDTVKKTVIKMWERLTMPLSIFFIILSAVPLSLSPPRQGADKGFIGAVAVLFGFYLIRSISVAMGTSEFFTFGGMIPLDLSLMVAAWLPLAIFGCIGVGLMVQKSKML